MRAVLSIALCFMCAGAIAAPGNQGPRAGQIEYSAALMYSFSDSFQGRGGSTLDLSSRTGFRVGIDYFVSNKLSVGFDAAWVRPSFDATLVPEDGSPSVDISHRASIFSGQFKGTYNFLESTITPYVEGGLGWTFFDSNVSDGTPIVGCWWDPFWGYICSDFYSSYNATSFSYGAGAGLRWNIASDLAVKVGYRWLEVEADRLREKPVLETALIEFSYRF